jgi:uncharacterized heparinase superfamily protein
MTRPRPGMLARTIARLQPGQIVLRPWARVAPHFARALARPVAVDTDAASRIRRWAGAVVGVVERSAVEEARALIGGRPMYAGQVVEVNTDRTIFPSRLAEYEFHYRRWLVGLALMRRRGELKTDEVLRRWDRMSERFSSSATIFEPYVLARRSVSEAITIGLLDNESSLAHLARDCGALGIVTESHLGANHELTHHAVIATLRLLLGGAVAGAASLDRYTRMLRVQVDADGLHEERSPAYHLAQIADLRQVRVAADLCGLDTADLDSIDARMTRAISVLLHPDGTTPMFHDSTAVSRPSAADLSILPGGNGLSDLESSGLLAWREAVNGHPLHIVGDFGSPRPRHQPGHQHAAPFAFEVWWGGLFITSAGVTTYAAGDRRMFERGAAAHASVRVDGADPAEIWSAFRMGRGYEVTERTVRATDRGFSATAVHDGFRARRHRRTIERGGEILVIRDAILGEGEAGVEIFFPIAPQWTVVADSKGRAICEDKDRVVTVDVEGADLRIDPFTIAREFGLAMPAQCIVARRRAALPLEITTTLRFSLRA